MTRESAPGRVQAYANWNGRTPTAAELAEYEAEGQRRRRQRREFRIVDEDGTATSTRDEIAADDAHCRGATVHYRDHGPHDEHPGPWRVYGTAEYADVDDLAMQIAEGQTTIARAMHARLAHEFDLTLAAIDDAEPAYRRLHAIAMATAPARPGPDSET